MKTLKNVAIVALVLFLGTVFVLSNKEGVPIEQSEEILPSIVKDTRNVFDGLDDFSKNKEVRRKVELVEKEAFLNHRKEVLESKYQIEIAEIEQALDSVRGSLSVS
jgi:regulator of sigma D